MPSRSTLPPRPHLLQRVTTNLLLAACCLLPLAAASAETLESWRADAAELRILIENDAVQAHRQAQRLIDILPRDATASDRARALNLLARAELYLGMTVEAGKHARAALELAERGGDAVGQVEADLVIMLNAVNAARLDELSAAVQHAMERMQDIHNRPDLLGEIMLRTGMMYRRMGIFDDSVTHALQAMDIAKRSGDPLALAFAHHGLAAAFEHSGHPRESHEQYTLMLEAARAGRSKALQISALIGLGYMESDLGDLRAGEHRHREGLALARDLGGPFYTAHAMFALADNLTRQDRREEAATLYDENVAIFERGHNLIGLWWTLNARADNHRARGHLQAARADADRAYALAEQIGIATYRHESAKRMATILVEQGDYARAYGYSAEAVAMAEKTVRERASQRIIELSRRYQNESRQREIDRLNRLHEEETRHNQFLLVILAASLVLLAISAFFALRLRQTNQRMANEIDERIRAEERLILKSHALDQVREAAYLLNEQGRFHYVNAEACRALGFSRSELLKMAVSDIDPPWTAEKLASMWPRLQSEGGSTFESSHRRKDGSSFPVEIAATFFDFGGQAYVLALARDITERKTLEIALIAREREFRTLAENLPDNVIRYDLQCRKVYVNPAMSRMTNRPAEDLIGETPFESTKYVDESMTRYHAALEATLTTGIPQEIEFEVRDDPEGNVVHNIRFLAERDERGTIIGALAIGRDITEQKRMEAALASREREFRTLAENLPDNVIRYNLEGRATYVNPNLLRITGTPAEAILGKTPVEFSDTPQSRRYQGTLERVMHSGVPEHMEIHVLLPSGEFRTHQVHFVAERRGNGAIRGAIAIGRDITPLKEAKKRLAASHQQLRALIAQHEAAREEERKRIAREIHDELGQTLTALKLGISTLKLRYNTNLPGLEERIQDLKGLADRSIQVVRDVATSLRPSALDMGIGPALEWLAGEFHRHTGIPCVLDLRPPERRSPDDACALVLFRLAQEALTNTARYAEASKVWITLIHQDGHCLLKLRDDGKGFIPGAVGRKSFGLLGMRERVESLGGQLSIDSTPGRGVRIKAIIPFASPLDGRRPHIYENEPWNLNAAEE
ncbi:MAG: PAS domain S-box protein [Pseudomonadota bacterium]